MENIFNTVSMLFGPTQQFHMSYIRIKPQPGVISSRFIIRPLEEMIKVVSQLLNSVRASLDTNTPCPWGWHTLESDFLINHCLLFSHFEARRDSLYSLETNIHIFSIGGLLCTRGLSKASTERWLVRLVWSQVEDRAGTLATDVGASLINMQHDSKQCSFQFCRLVALLYIIFNSGME